MESPLDAINVKAITLDSYSGIVDQHVNRVVLLLDHLQEGINAVGVRDVQLLKVDGGSGIFGQNLGLGLLGKFKVAARHDDVPSLFAGEVVDDSVADAFVGAGNNDVSESLHKDIVASEYPSYI